jgi:hypothetical protein
VAKILAALKTAHDSEFVGNVCNFCDLCFGRPAEGQSLGRRGFSSPAASDPHRKPPTLMGAMT